MKDNNEIGRDNYKEVVRSFGRNANGYENYSHSLNLWEINCSNRKTRLLSYSDYNLSGEILDTYDTSGPWVNLIPDSVGYSVAETVCHFK